MAGRRLRQSLWLAAALVSMAVAAQDDTSGPFVLDGDSLSFDRQTNQVTIDGFRSTQNGLRIEADHALVTAFETDQGEWRLSGSVRMTMDDGALSADEAVAIAPDADRSEWRLTGRVRMSMGSASLSADMAVFVFQSRRLVSAELTGTPAAFEQTNPDTGRSIGGGANRLHFDEQERSLRLLDGAWISEGPNEFRGCDLIYDFERERVTSGSSECGEPVRIRIQPPSGDDGRDPQ